MIWDDFYNRYSDWSESTVRTRISSLEDIGSGEDVVDVCLNLYDEKIKSQLIRKSMKLGVRFTRDDVVELDGAIPEELFEEVARYAGFSVDGLFADEGDFSEQVRIAERRADAYIEQTGNLRKQKFSAGKAFGLGAVLGLLSGLFNGSKKAHRSCNSDCANCPPHYGYRYGRWYYGRGHNYGCEFGGNKGGGRKD